VINRYQSGDVLPVKDAEDLLQTQIYWKLPNDYRLSATSLTRGVPVTVEDPNSKLAKSYADLVKKLSGAVHSGGFRSLQETGGGASRFRKLFGNDKGVRNVS
jgi:septum formation inhibitor-activating ATPase MinD